MSSLTDTASPLRAFRRAAERLALALLLLATLAGIAALRARGCECNGSLPPRKEMAFAQAVFTGKVIKIVQGERRFEQRSFLENRVTFQIDETIKVPGKEASPGGTLTVRTGIGGGDCGCDFEEGQSYLVYAYGEPGDLETNSCTRTQPLARAEQEILELQNRLPKPGTPAREPVLKLLGSIHDAGYAGYVFEIQNRLHDRIFFQHPRAQVFRDGAWQECLPNLDIAPRPDLSPEETAKSLAEMQAELAESEKSPDARWLAHLSRLTGRSEFFAAPSQTWPWRIGLAYVTEPELDAGQKLSKTQHLFWSERVEPGATPKALSFAEAFLDDHLIPYPLGQPPAPAAAEAK